jgi:hypothetical protein
VAQPVEIFKNIKGFTRDFAVDSLPAGYLWDMVDAIPNRKGARVEQRGAWEYTGTANYGGTIMGGYDTAFIKGPKLLIVANSHVYDVSVPDGVPTDLGTGPATMVQNGIKLHDKVYFLDAAGAFRPRRVEWTAASPTLDLITDVNAPKAKVGIAYLERLFVAGDPANPSNIYSSPLPEDGGPTTGTWDVTEGHIGTNNEVTGMAAMAGQVLVFHPGSIERLRGKVPPGYGVDVNAVDMFMDTLTEQVGCTQPHTIVPWRENIIFADERGIFLTDGSAVKNLTELGGIGDFWRVAYGARINAPGSVSCGTFLDYLIVTVNCSVPPALAFNFTLACDLNTRSWFRFSNWPATCYIQSESAIEQSWAGHLTTNRLSRVSSMFQDPVPPPDPLPDYVDGNGLAVLPSLTTGFHRLDKEEGMTRLHNLFVSYHHQSFLRSPAEYGLRVEYRTDPPTPEDIDMATGSVVGWAEAGQLPDVIEYSRKKLPVGKRGYGVMVRVTDLTPSRITRVYSVGVQKTSQDRAKVTT